MIAFRHHFSGPKPEHLLFNLLNSLPDPVYFKDLQSNFLLVNAAAARGFGLDSPEEAIGKSDKDFFAPEHALGALADEQEIIRTGRPLVAQVEKETWPDGSETWVCTTKLPLLNDNGEVIGTFGVSRDITESKRAELAINSAKRAEEAANQIKDDLLSRESKNLSSSFRIGYKINSEGNVEEQRLQILGRYDILNDRPEPELNEIVELASHICGTPISLVSIIDHEKQWFKAKVGIDFTSTPRDISFCAHAKATDELLLIPDARQDERFTSNPLVTGAPGIRFYAGAPLVTSESQVLGTLCVIDTVPRTLTSFQQKTLKVLARHIMKHLELRYQNARQETLLKEAQAASRAKSDFLAIMSHEIRTPLNGVIGMTEILGDTHLTDMQRECVDTVKSSGEALLSVINDVLDYSKIEAGHLQMEKRSFDLQSCIEGAVDLFTPQIRKKNLEVTYLIAPTIRKSFLGDRMRIRQILVNLIGNAIKFTEKGEISLSVTSSEQIGNKSRLLFSVTDTGIGIPADAVGKLFHPFQQVDSSIMRRFGGTGLGLVISKRLAEMMEGKMWVESRVGEGSTFSFELVLEQSAASHHEVPAEKGALVGRSVLIIDDNATNRRILEIQCGSWGMYAQSVPSGEEALERIKSKTFDIMILDFQMPGMDGASLARELRKQIQTPFVLLSSSHDHIAGPDSSLFRAQITKPIKHSALQRVLLEILAHEKCTAGIPRRGTLESSLAERFPLRILLAEDNLVNQKVALLMLSRFGYQAHTVQNGRLAVEAASSTQYDLVLMDIQMPEMNGIEAMTLLKREGAKCPVIFALTAEAIAGDRERILGLGFDGYISKPLKAEALQQCFKTAHEICSRPSMPASGNPVSAV